MTWFGIVRVSHSCQILSVDGACLSLATFVVPTSVKTIIELFRPAFGVQAPRDWRVGLGDDGYYRRGNFGSSVVHSTVSISDGTIVQEVGDRGRCSGVKSCKIAFLGELPIHTFIHLCCKMYRLAKMDIIIDRQRDRQTDGRTDDSIMPIAGHSS